MRVLIVDDHDPWRRYASTTLQKQHGLHVIGEVSDGLEAVQKAEELQPDLILLDIGLPTLNGIEAARRIRKVSPGSKILFVSENRSADVAEKALSTGAGGYVVKSEAGRELLPAVKAVLKGERFLSASLAGDDNVHLHSPTSETEEAIGQNSYWRSAESAWVSESLKSLIDASGADFGNLQLFDSVSRVLRIVAQHGFQSEFLNYFDTVTEKHASASGAALKGKSRTVVQDVATDALFTTESRGVLLRANVRSVQSTPLVDAGALVGMVSTHYCSPNGITPQSLKQVDDFVVSLLAKMHGADQGEEQ